MRRRFCWMLALYALLHVYMCWRLILPEPSPFREVATAVVAALAIGFPVVMRYVRFRRVPRETARPWLLVACLWFGSAAYLLLAAIASHLAVAFGADARASGQVCAALALIVVAIGLFSVARGHVAKHVRVPIDKRARAYKLVHLSDVHVGTLIGRLQIEAMVHEVNALDPDLIVITGDLVDGSLSDLARDVEPLRDLRARDGVFAVTGNYEFYYSSSLAPTTSPRTTTYRARLGARFEPAARARAATTHDRARDATRRRSRALGPH